MSSSISMKSVGLLCVLAVLFTTVVNGQEACTTGTSCSALAALRFRVNGIGRCSGTSRADCAAFAAASDPCFAEIRRKIELETCEPVDITIFAECAAGAVAAVYASAYTGIECTGAGSGCGFAQSNAEAWACSFASAIATLVVEIAGETVCDVDLASMAEVFARVATEAQVMVCSDGGDSGFVSDFQREFGFRVETIIADATASCLVACTPVGIDAQSDGDTGVDTGISVSGGNADTNEGGGRPAGP